jgi:nucleoside-diphosphate-sugar epimerase
MDELYLTLIIETSSECTGPRCPRLIAVARDKKVSAFVGDGANRWPAVHVRDAARLFHLALEKLPAGAAVHSVADEGILICDVAEVIGRHWGCRARAAGVGTDAARTDGGPLLSARRVTWVVDGVYWRATFLSRGLSEAAEPRPSAPTPR